VKIIIPVLENRGAESRVSSHFGRAPYFALYDSKAEKLKIIKNKKERFGRGERPAETMLKYKPDVVFAIDMGPRAIDLFISRGVKIETENFNTVKEIIENKDKLRKLEEVCKEHKH